MENAKLLKQYMVIFDLPSPFGEDMLDLVPEQKAAMDDLFEDGRLLSYTVALDRSQMWAIMLAEEESQLISYIDNFPMTNYMDFDYKEIMFHNTVHLMPSMSLN